MHYLFRLAALPLHKSGLHPDPLVGQCIPGLCQDAPRPLHLVVLKFNLERRQPDLLALCTTEDTCPNAISSVALKTLAWYARVVCVASDTGAAAGCSLLQQH